MNFFLRYPVACYGEFHYMSTEKSRIKVNIVGCGAVRRVFYTPARQSSICRGISWLEFIGMAVRNMFFNVWIET